MVAVTEFPASDSRSRLFSSRFASRLIELLFGFGGGERVKVAEIFVSSSFFSTLDRKVFLSGELIV